MPTISINLTNAQALRLTLGLSGYLYNGSQSPPIDTVIQKSGFIVNSTIDIWKDIVKRREYITGVNNYSDELRNILETGINFR